MVQGARTAADRWRRRVVAAEDDEAEDEEDLLFYDDMLVDAEDWLQVCSWVLEEVQAELDAGQPGQFWELGATLVEEEAEGATSEDLTIFVWAVVGEPPEMAVCSVGDGAEADSDGENHVVVDSGEDSETDAEAADEAVAEEAVAVVEEAEAEEEAAAEVGAEAVAKEAMAEAVAKAKAVAGAEAEAEDGATVEAAGDGLTTTYMEDEVASVPRTWKERKRLFDPGG